MCYLPHMCDWAAAQVEEARAARSAAEAAAAAAEQAAAMEMKSLKEELAQEKETRHAAVSRLQEELQALPLNRAFCGEQ